MDDIGRLDRRIQFLRKTAVDDGFTSDSGVFEDHGSPIWAQKRDISDGERYRASEVAAHVTTRFVVRWSTFAVAITPADRLTCEGLEYEITGIKEGTGRRQWIEITAAARND